MATNKKLRTPIIKPRTQGGTFYTFGSAMEDIGLNINEKFNKVELSHYILLNIPEFDASTLTGNRKVYQTNPGDYIFAEAFQDYVLNMETVLRNQDTYNYAANKTVSERVFWKWIFKGKDSLYFDTSNGYYFERDQANSITKAFGKIYSGSQRSDEFGLYNETFVQIPSSYGQMKVFFQPNYDENYKIKSSDNYYKTSNNGIIENIASSEYDASVNLIATGIPATGLFDASTGSSSMYRGLDFRDFLEAKLDISTLRSIYGNTSLTYDDIGFGNVPDASTNGDFLFNAILVYYSIYDPSGTNLLATNAYGVYILDNAVVDSSTMKYEFPTLSKKKTTNIVDGTSFSFRLNIKPSSAYSGDIVISDNSTGAFNMAEDFNDVLRNLNASINALKSNARLLQEIVDDNKYLKSFAADAIDKVNDIETSVNGLKNSGYMCVDCDSLTTYAQNDRISNKDDIAILNGNYKNLRLSDGTVVSRSVISGATETVYLTYDQIVIVSNVRKIRRTIRGYLHTTGQSEYYTMSFITNKDQTI